MEINKFEKLVSKELELCIKDNDLNMNNIDSVNIILDFLIKNNDLIKDISNQMFIEFLIYGEVDTKKYIDKFKKM